jgi:hypothetical protein
MKGLTAGNKRIITGLLIGSLAFSASPAFARGEEHGRRDDHSGRSYYSTNPHRDRYYHHDGRWYRSGWFGFSVAVSALTIGAIVTTLPAGHRTVIVAGTPYYYYDGTYFSPGPYGYEVIPAPVIVPTVVTVAAAAPAAVVEGTTVTINVPNQNGSFTPVILTKRGDGYIGPQGEYYTGHPTIEQLKALYGK